MANDFEEIADWGDRKFYVRDFKSAIIDIDDDEKEIPLVLVAEIMDYYEVTGEDSFKDKPFGISIDIMPQMDFIDKKHIQSAADDISEEQVGYTDVQTYMGGIPLLMEEISVQFEDLDDAEELLLSKEMKNKLNAMASMVGFYLDGRINRVGNTRWQFLTYMVDAEQNFYKL